MHCLECYLWIQTQNFDGFYRNFRSFFRLNSDIDRAFLPRNQLKVEKKYVKKGLFRCCIPRDSIMKGFCGDLFKCFDIKILLSKTVHQTQVSRSWNDFRVFRDVYENEPCRRVFSPNDFNHVFISKNKKRNKHSLTKPQKYHRCIDVAYAQMPVI